MPRKSPDAQPATVTFADPHGMSEGDWVTVLVPARGWRAWLRWLLRRSPMIERRFQVTGVTAGTLRIQW